MIARGAVQVEYETAFDERKGKTHATKVTGGTTEERRQGGGDDRRGGGGDGYGITHLDFFHFRLSTFSLVGSAPDLTVNLLCTWDQTLVYECRCLIACLIDALILA